MNAISVLNRTWLTMSIPVNDIHSKLNSTRVEAIRTPETLGELREIVRAAASMDRPMAVCGGRHAMGGHQFLEDAVLVDTSKLDRVLHLDVECGTITVESGCTWPRLVEQYEALQMERLRRVHWGFAQKQTGADRLTIGGAVAANAHGRGLRMKPLVGDVVSLQLVDSRGDVVTCLREENQELFRLSIGGYGLFGVSYAVTLKLRHREILRRAVRVIDIEDAVSAARRAIAQGYLYGDFQFDIDESSPDFLTKGVFSGYIPAEGTVDIPKSQNYLKPEQWEELLYHLSPVRNQRTASAGVPRIASVSQRKSPLRSQGDFSERLVPVAHQHPE